MTGSGADPITWHDYAGLRAALNAWRERRNISFEALDEVTGAPKGYSAKIFSPRGQRRVGMESLLWYLGGLGIEGVLQHSSEAFALVEARLAGRNKSQVRCGGAIKIEFSRRHMQKIGRNGAKKRWAAKRKRSAGASKAATARWNGSGRRVANPPA
jgi:hypothetical protein